MKTLKALLNYDVTDFIMLGLALLCMIMCIGMISFLLYFMWRVDGLFHTNTLVIIGIAVPFVSAILWWEEQKMNNLVDYLSNKR